MDNPTWTDGKGIAFVDCRSRLPERARDFPTPSLVRCDETKRYHRLLFTRCQMCGKEFLRWGVKAEQHHIVGGARRSDVSTNLIMLCNGFGGCHSAVQHQTSMLRIVLAAKVMTDREHTCWVELATLLGRHLPDPEWPAYWKMVRESHVKGAAR